MQRLTDIGFKKVGKWSYTNNTFNHDISINLEARNLLYSFISDEEVFYIGKTTDKLKNRMSGYKNAGGSQKTNVRVKKEILELLKNGKLVYIYILLDEAKLMFENYKVSLASGLEDNLIASIKPKWNFRGNNRIKEQELPAEDENVIIETLEPFISQRKTVEIKLGQEYWNKGFFNFSKSELHLLPKETTAVTLLLGVDAQFLTTGRFAFSTQDGQPRVHGNKSLKQWFQDNYRQGEKVKVDIIKPDLYCIN